MERQIAIGTRSGIFLLVALTGALLGGCFAAQVYPTIEDRSISLGPGDLERDGVSFITPSAATGQEEEKQAIALVFAEVMREARGAMRVVPLAETLGDVNKAELGDQYSRMYSEYRDTGLLNREILRQVAEVTGVRYVAQIKVQSFHQAEKERLGIFGLRLVETKTAGLRLFFQIWDSADGTVAWEATQELHYAYDSITEEQLTLHKVVSRAAQELVSKLP
jgi:hypothetical protein